MEEYDDLLTPAEGFSDKIKKHFMFISKSGYTQPVRERAESENVMLLTIDDLFLVCTLDKSKNDA